MNKRVSFKEIADEGVRAFREQCEIALSMLFERAGVNADSELKAPLEIQTLLSNKGYRLFVQKVDTVDVMADLFVLMRYGQPVYGYLVKLETQGKGWTIKTYPVTENLLRKIVKVDSQAFENIESGGKINAV